MKSFNRYTIMLMFFALIHVAGCASTSAPKGWLSPPSDAQSEGFGGWISVEMGQTNRPNKRSLRTATMRVRGELIAVNPNQLFVLTSQGLISVSASSISRMKLTPHDVKEGWWVGLGALSTLSHGAWLVFTLPSWIIGGLIAKRNASHASQLNYPVKSSWDEFPNYARFPQGLPESIDAQSLKPKPHKKGLHPGWIMATTAVLLIILSSQ